MPTWPRPADVVFDHVAAASALDAVAAMRFTLEFTWDVEAASAADALALWDGMAAEAFRASHGSRRNTTEDLARQLRLLQAGIEGAVGDAHAAQARADDLQAEWDAQRRAEIAATEAADADPAEDDRPVSPPAGDGTMAIR